MFLSTSHADYYDVPREEGMSSGALMRKKEGQ